MKLLLTTLMLSLPYTIASSTPTGTNTTNNNGTWTTATPTTLTNNNITITSTPTTTNSTGEYETNHGKNTTHHHHNITFTPSQSPTTSVIAAGVPTSSNAPTVPHRFDAVAWSAGGVLGLIYQSGVLHELKKHNVMKPTMLQSGAAAGALLAGMDCAGVTYQQIFGQISAMLDCQNPTSCKGSSIITKLDEEMRTLLQGVLPIPDSTWLEQCSSTVTIGLTRTNPKGCVKAHNSHSLPPTDALYSLTAGTFGTCTIDSSCNDVTVTNFRSRPDLIQALLGSNYVASLSGPSGCASFRDMKVKSGAYLSTLYLRCPSNSNGDTCLQILSNPQLRSQYSAAQIYPGIRGKNTLPIPLDQWQASEFNVTALLAAGLRNIKRAGRRDTRFYLQSIGLTT